MLRDSLSRRGIQHQMGLLRVALTVVVAAACSSKAQPVESSSPPPAQGDPGARRDTAVVVRENDLELFLHLKPVPLRAGDTAILLHGIRNVGTVPRQVSVDPCEVEARGFVVVDNLICATSAVHMTVKPGESWELQTLVTFEGPPGSPSFRDQGPACSRGVGWVEARFEALALKRNRHGHLNPSACSSAAYRGCERKGSKVG